VWSSVAYIPTDTICQSGFLIILSTAKALLGLEIYSPEGIKCVICGSGPSNLVVNKVLDATPATWAYRSRARFVVSFASDEGIREFVLDIPTSLTPEYLHQGLAPYLVAISTLQL
jgi:hypothetical protein